MLLKSADPHHDQRIELLTRLQRDPSLDAHQIRWTRQEVARWRAGQAGERQAAHYIDNRFADSPNHAVIHDLRVSIDGEVAQVDHLVLNRVGMCFLLETKNFNGNLVINDQGEFTVEYGADRFGIPSPIEQSRRHERVLAKLCERLGIGGRLGTTLSFGHVVLVHPRATIERPSPKVLPTDNVIKADQFPSWYERNVQNMSGLSFLGKVAQFRSPETVREWGDMLARQHRPADPLAVPPFMQAAVDRLARPPAPPAASRPAPPPAADRRPAAPTPAAAEAAEGRKKLVCAQCGQKISFAEGRFCWNNPARFGGLQYCREHQAGR